MTLHAIIQQSQKLIVDNSPAILTALGATGVITTAYLTGKASFRAADVIQEKIDDLIAQHGSANEVVQANALPSTTDRIKLVWKLYVPPVASGLVSVSAIIFANRISTRRAATMAAAYALSERAYSEYKDKVVETIGKNKELKVRDDIAQDRVSKHPVDNQQVIVTGGGDVLCYDSYTGRYFFSSMETLKKAQNDINYQIINHGFTSLTTFYSKIGLSGTKMSDDFGWDSDKLLDLVFSTTMSDNDRPCIALDFKVAPIHFRGN